MKFFDFLLIALFSLFVFHIFTKKATNTQTKQLEESESIKQCQETVETKQDQESDQVKVLDQGDCILHDLKSGMGFKIVTATGIDEIFLTYEYLRDNNLFYKQISVIPAIGTDVENIKPKSAIFGRNVISSEQSPIYRGRLTLDDEIIYYIQRKNL